MIVLHATESHYRAHLLPIARAMGDETWRWSHEGFVPGPNDTVVVAGFNDLKTVPTAVERVVLVSHGADQTYNLGGFTHGSYAGGRGRERVGLFVCPSRRAADANLATYPDATALVCGSPWAESLPRWHGSGPGVTFMGEGIRAAREAYRPAVAFAWHWDLTICPETRTAWPFWRDDLPGLRENYRLIGHGHPRAMEQLGLWYAGMGIEPVQELADVIRRADLLVVDNSSAGYEAAARGMPVLWVDAPCYRREIEHGLRFWSDIPGLRLAATREQSVGAMALGCWGRGSLSQAVQEALQDPPEAREARDTVIPRVYAQTGGQAASIAAAGIRDWSRLVRWSGTREGG